jgi:hypothetical protein
LVCLANLLNVNNSSGLFGFASNRSPSLAPAAAMPVAAADATAAYHRKGIFSTGWRGGASSEAGTIAGGGGGAMMA